MKKIVGYIEKIIDVLTVILVVALVLFVAMQVVFRFLKFPSPWTEEMARFTFVYITFLGSVLAIKEGGHIVVDVVVERLPNLSKRIVGVVFSVIVAAFLMTVIAGSIPTLKVNKEVTAASLTWFKMTYVYISILISSILMLGYTIRNILCYISGKPISTSNNISSGGDE